MSTGYHQLFADLLRYRLRAEDPDREHALHRRAAAFFAETGDPENAIGHFLAAGLDAEAFQVLRGNLIGAFYQEDGRLLRGLVAQFEGHSTTSQPARLPDLALASAASGPAGKAGPWIARANRHASHLTDVGRARLAVAQALLAQQYGDALGIERAFSGYPGPKDLPDAELAYCVPGFLARGPALARRRAGRAPGLRGEHGSL